MFSWRKNDIFRKKSIEKSLQHSPWILMAVDKCLYRICEKGIPEGTIQNGRIQKVIMGGGNSLHVRIVILSLTLSVVCLDYFLALKMVLEWEDKRYRLQIFEQSVLLPVFLLALKMEIPSKKWRQIGSAHCIFDRATIIGEFSILTIIQVISLRGWGSISQD